MTPPARRVALDALVHIDGGGYANLVVPARLDQSGLAKRDRDFVTELVYGTTRRQRSCDWLVDRHLDGSLDELDPPVRAALRMGAYQLAFLGTKPYAAVSGTVAVVPARGRGLVNAVLRKLARHPRPEWPDRGTALSYPDWIVDELVAALGEAVAVDALEVMNEPPPVTRRPDGYVQDLASQWVVDLVGAQAGEIVVDSCAGPGGKATGLAAVVGTGGVVLASDVQAHRAALVAGNAARLSYDAVVTVQADGRRPPVAAGRADRVLVDAPCSGLGVLRRRPDARWRVGPSDVTSLAELQQQLVAAAAPLLKPGGTVTYSVCTLTTAETVGIDDWLAGAHAELEALPPPDAPWEPAGRGARLLPQTAGTDGMYVLRLRAP